MKTEPLSEPGKEWAGLGSRIQAIGPVPGHRSHSAMFVRDTWLSETWDDRAEGQDWELGGQTSRRTV